MTRLRSIVKTAVPARLRSALRAVHRELVFRRAMRRFLRRPSSTMRSGHGELADLIYGWGNEGWSAPEEYLSACIDQATVVAGPILECGCGLSTVLVGAIAKRRGQRHWALEHLPEWAGKVQRCLDRYGLDSVTLCPTPLADYGEFAWYDAREASMPPSFALVICDGPPGDTKGGRYGLVPIMRDRIGPGSVILLDDAGREQELAIARRWAAELGASMEHGGSEKPFVKLTVVGQELRAPA